MAELRELVTSLGHTDVATYIQSGIVLLDSDLASAELTRRIETMLAAAFDYVPTAVVRSRRQLHAIGERAPQGFGSRPATHRYDVIFLKIIGSPIYPSITIRNWNTTTKLLELMG